MDAVSSLPSLNDLLRQNPNLNTQKFPAKLNSENIPSRTVSNNTVNRAPQIDKSSSVDRVTAWFFGYV